MANLDGVQAIHDGGHYLVTQACSSCLALVGTESAEQVVCCLGALMSDL